MSNEIIILDKDGNDITDNFSKQIKCEFKGDNSKVVIKSPKKIKKAHFILGDNCRIDIDENIAIVENLFVWASARNSQFKIGKNCRIQGLNVSLQDEPDLSISIGSYCLIGSNCSIRSSDGHTVYDLKTREILNKPGDIVLHEHIWLGRSVEILKNVEIQKDTVVGMGSIVTKTFNEGNCVLAGRPAKIVKRGINWSNKITSDFK